MYDIDQDVSSCTVTLSGHMPQIVRAGRSKKLSWRQWLSGPRTWFPNTAEDRGLCHWAKMFLAHGVEANLAMLAMATDLGLRESKDRPLGSGPLRRIKDGRAEDRSFAPLFSCGASFRDHLNCP